MRSVKEILRQKWHLKRSHREVALSVGLSVGAVGKTVSRAKLAQLDWSQMESMSEEALRAKLYGQKRPRGASKIVPDCGYIHRERSRPGVTLELLHLEYLEKHPNGYKYTSFCNFYRDWLKKQKHSMRQIHRAGEKLYVDYSGKRPHIVDPKTGEIIEVELFVAVLGASNFTFAEATKTQQVDDWIRSHVRAFEYFGGVPGAVVPDQLKSGVSRACRYEPKIQRTYEELSQHYGTAILPARPIHPKDKAKVEVGVQIVQRWILARLRNQTFFSLDALNERIAELLEELNDRVMKQYQESRRQLFKKLDQPALRPLPQERFVVGHWKKARVNIDYHIEFLGHYYSVPYQHIHEDVEIRYTAMTVEVFRHGERITSHERSYQERGRHTTQSEHMPKAHQRHLSWTPSRLIDWASHIGPKTEEMVKTILRERRHPEMGYRSCLGILRLARRDGPERLEAACQKALLIGARSYRHLNSMLKNGLEQAALPDVQEGLHLVHENLRGHEYYR